ncbi:MAG: N-acetyltransferase [Flavobacteriales bacterium]|nr:N-acetyltransferase [Flavobacteriales bacterium]
MNENRQIIHDSIAKRFILEVDGKQAFVNYSLKDGIMRLLYAETPFELRGQGIGHELVEKTFDYIREHDMKAIAICGFIRAVRYSSDKWNDCIS